MNEDIYSMLPINKSAALSVSQSGCEDEATIEYRRDSMAKALQRIEQELASLPKKHRYKKDLGEKKFSLQNEIRILNKELDVKNIKAHDFDGYILAECKRSLTPQKWNEIICKAKAVKEEDIRFHEIKLKELTS